jgi:predicted nucleic acid-binding protein
MSHEARPVYILDSFALLAFLNGEAGVARVQNVLHTARRGQAHAALSTINLGEVLYITDRERGLPAAQRALAAIEQLPISLMEATRERVQMAAHVKAHYRVSYADAFAVALVQELGGVILTGDPEFVVVKQLIQVEWLPRD